MKKTFAIFLIALLLFNVLGFYGVLVGIQYKNAQDLTRQFNSDTYEPAETITLEFPIAVPYAYDYQDYVRVDGAFEYQGESYRMVKQKFENDVLYIVCYKDNQDKHIKRALTDYVKTFADQPSDARQQTSKLFQNFCKDFMSTTTSVEHETIGWSNDISFSSADSRYEHISLSLTSPPPRA